MRINLVNFAYMSHPLAKNVEVIIPEVVPEGEERFIAFKVWLPKKALKQYLRNCKYIKWLTPKKALFWRWLRVKLLERTNLIDVERNLRAGVREYLGQQVTVIVDVLVHDG